VKKRGCDPRNKVDPVKNIKLYNVFAGQQYLAKKVDWRKALKIMSEESHNKDVSWEIAG
jgi:hypothetical protein